MTGLNFNYKDIFRSLRLGFSAKKVGMGMLGLVFGFTGYTALTWLAHLAAGNDWLSIWETYRLLPFPNPNFSFPWYSWLIYGAGVVWFLIVMLITGTAVARVTYEQLRGNEFFEAGAGFQFALKNSSALILSSMLIIAFIALIVVGGLILSAIGLIPHLGPLLTALLAIVGFFASLFIVYLLIVLLFTLLFAPAVVGTMGNDTFDTLFEVFSCVNEQPGRFVWYTFLVALLAKVGSFLFGQASNLAGRIGSLVLGTFMGERWYELLRGAEFVFKISIPRWGVLEPLHQMLIFEANLYGLPQIYSPSTWTYPLWSTTVGATLLGMCGYAIGIMVIAYGLSVWFSGTVLSLAVIIKKKDDKNIFESTEEDEEIIEPTEEEKID
ncbi:MAG: hypothetical protein ACUVUD_06975 [bacterium]